LDPELDKHLAKQSRMVAIVIAVTMLLWIGVQFLGSKIGLHGDYAFLFDLAALAGFIWALVVTYQIWRKRRED
jgi:hypothetical protein